MIRALRCLSLIAAIYIAIPAMAQETAKLKCSAGQDRVWLYDSLASLGVEAKLKCGDSVQILSREKAFVKVRANDGTEGYVPDTSLPKAAMASNDPRAPEQMSLADQARAARAARTAHSTSANASGSSASATANEPKEPKSVAAVPRNEKPAEIKPVPQPNPAVTLQPAVASASSPAPASPKTVAATTASKPAETSTHDPSASEGAAASHSSKSSSAKVKPAPGNNKVPHPKAQPQPQPPAAKPSHPANSSTNTSSASNVTPAPSAKSKNSNARPGAVGAGTNAPHAVAVSSNLNAEPPRAVAAVAKPSQDDDPDSEDYPDRHVEDESANPACSTFFSVYGLTPGQYKWLANDRSKKYSSICPARAPNMVDYVVILTHDVPFYNSTMPEAVHTDANGFSDFTPMSMVDTSLLSATDLEKSKHEYVWVFKTRRGAFDPAKFSPRRKPQFTKLESGHSGERTIEDAFRFMAEGGAQ